ncbi:MAG TPA: hypothetical protein DCE78_08075 [Bacteroidetes bacterium]|nr:hypothetical protein [Bacteroidota bacterium]
MHKILLAILTLLVITTPPGSQTFTTSTRIESNFVANINQINNFIHPVHITNANKLNSLSIHNPSTIPPSDQATFEQWLREGQAYHKSGKTVPQLIEFYAQKQLGIPYVGGLLEIPKLETLILTLEGSDCVLFVEYSLALTLTTLQNSTSYSDLSRNVALLRYQNGQVEGYASRLHYFSDWLKTNQEKGILDILHKNNSSLPLLDPVNFMTKNRSSYRQLSESDSLFQLMQEREAFLRSNQIRFIPEHRIPDFESSLQTGDILSFVSTVNGLDIAHTALIVREGNRVGFYHASTTGKVIKEPKTLYEYTTDRRNVEGIIVARLANPVN